MVLWEITLATAYFLGLKRTYRLALKIQRRIISPKYPKIRHFAHRRTRGAFDVALRVHRSIQQRDITAGRSLGNLILRWLDRMRPSAQVQSKPPESSGPNMNTTNQCNKPSTSKSHGTQVSGNKESDNRHMFTSSTNIWSKSFPSIVMMMKPPRSTGTMTHYRHLCISGYDLSRLNYNRHGSDSIIRNDIRQWILQKGR